MTSNTIQLGSVAEILNGFAFKSEWFQNAGTPVIRIGDICNEEINTSTCVAVDENSHKIPESCRTKKGDILMALSGATTGKIGIVRANFDGALVNQRIAIIRSTEPATQQYIQYIFTGHLLESLLKEAWGAAQANLSPKALRELEIPFPPLEEQRRIAAILDQADAVRRKRQSAIALTEELLRSAFLEMFGDPVRNSKGWGKFKLGELLTFLTSGSRGWAKYYALEGNLFLRIQNVKGGKLQLDDVAYINPPDSAEGRRTCVKEGDVLVSITADLGRTAVIPKGLKSAYINQHLALLRLKQDIISPAYLAAFLASIGGQMQFERLNREGVKAGLNFDDIRGLHILLPPLEIQQKYEIFFTQQIDTLNRYKLCCDEAQSLFNSLLQRAFRGEL